MMVDVLAVMDAVTRRVLVRDRLGPSRRVNNAQAPHAQRDACADVMAFLVGTAVADGAAHHRQLRFSGVGGSAPSSVPRNAAHLGACPRASRRGTTHQWCAVPGSGPRLIVVGLEGEKSRSRRYDRDMDVRHGNQTV